MYTQVVPLMLCKFCETDFHIRMSVIGLHIKFKDIVPDDTCGLLFRYRCKI